eukprot:TRINITY_DN41_c0_g2_i2.p1 TRINITY_DN41_c0_g2~~TRINITY_DN41_c0_g2_i2.p1  ORF type:complete len:182 (-),score=21.20 TRINITY_DN41_c0_g2_i2:379-924(-)
MVPQNRRRKNRALQALCAKTKVCKYVRNGESCPDESRCNFAHSEKDLCSLPDLAYTRFCRDYAAGYCPVGDNCKFAHEENAVRQLPGKEKVDNAATNMADKHLAVTSGPTAKKGYELRRIPYRYPGKPDIHFVQSFLDWDANEGEVEYASGYRLHCKNTFLTVSFSTNERIRSRSAPPTRS